MFDTAVDYGSPATNGALNGGGTAVNRATAGMNSSSVRMQEINRVLQALSEGNGSSIRYQDAWDENTKARAVNANLANELILLQSLLNELLAARINLKNAETSQTVKVVDADGSVSPFTCDPVILEQMQIPQNLWPDCARTQSSGGGVSETLTPLSGGAANVVEAMQNQAN